MPRPGLPAEVLKRSPLAWLLAYAALLFVFTAAIQRMSPHVTSRLATIDSLVERGSFAIDGSSYSDTVDKIFIQGRYYSHQPPATAVLSAGVFYPFHLFGMRLAPGHPASYVLLTFMVNGIATLAGMVCFFRALRWTSLAPSMYLPVTAALACASLIFPYSTTLNSHGLCAALTAIGLYAFLLSLQPGHGRAAAFAAGFAFSLSAAADHAMTAFFGVFALCLLLRREHRRLLPWFLLPCLFTLAPTFAYYSVIGHSFKPFAARPEFFAYPGSPWVTTGESTTRLTGASRNSLPFAIQYGFLMLFGKRGFLLYNSLACLAIYGVVRAAAARVRYWREALAVLLGSGAVIAYYSFSSANFSGASYSIRWFVPMLPLWWFFGTSALRNFAAWGRGQRWLLTAACALSLFYAFAGALNPWPEEWRGYHLPIDSIVNTFHRRLFVPY